MIVISRLDAEAEQETRKGWMGWWRGVADYRSTQWGPPHPRPAELYVPLLAIPGLAGPGAARDGRRVRGGARGDRAARPRLIRRAEGPLHACRRHGGPEKLAASIKGAWDAIKEVQSEHQTPTRSLAGDA